MPSVDPFFGPQHLPAEDEEFVAWVDVMGTSSMTEWSLEVASTNIGKLQTAVIESERGDDFNLYPMMDGIYITSAEKDPLAKFLGELFGRFSTIAIERHDGTAEAPIKFAPLLRAGVAKGSVLHGYDLSKTKLADHPIRDAIILGTPVAQAHACEENAPPFGLRLHSSVTENSEAENAE